MLSFRLNMKILKDAFSDKYAHVTLFSASDAPYLEDVRLWQKGRPMKTQYVYMLSENDVPVFSGEQESFCFIVSGKTDVTRFPKICSVLIVEDDADFSELFTLAQATFERYAKWNLELYEAMSSSHPLDAMLEASLKIFRNPIFVHDTNFFILSCPRRAPGMLVWEQNARTGWNIVPLSLINDFKVDPEYLNTLNTTGPSLFSAEQRGYPILYMNLWNDGRYLGRICVDELETPILPGQYHILSHLAKLILSSIRNNRLFLFNMGNDTEEFFRKFLDGEIRELSAVMNMLHFLNWERNDHYLCLHLEAKQQNIRMLSSAATIGHIETQIPEGHAFPHDGGITVLVNLSYSHVRISDILSRLAILLRESLLKMGASSEIFDFMQLPQGYYQAKTALELGQKSSSMNWYYRFDDYILEFFLDKGRKNLSPELLCSNKLLILKRYDAENSTALYQTLKVYLDLERNVLQTAKTLFIHRSTLFYRLERIRKIADIDFENAKERLVLQISFYILEQTNPEIFRQTAQATSD